MAHIATQAIGSILDHYADVIEGGNAYNSGSSYYGIPGRYSRDPGILSGDDTPIAAEGAGNTTTINVTGYSWPERRWVRDDGAPFFLLCTAGATNAIGEARRITAWDNTGKDFTVDAFSTAPGSAGEFTVLEGFRRLPDTIDINADDSLSEGGYDRSFNLALSPVAPRDTYGNGTETWDGFLRLTLRMLKHGRLHQWQASAIENITYLASVMTKGHNPDHRDGTYVRALLSPAETPEVLHDDRSKLVVAIQMPIIYRIQRGF